MEQAILTDTELLAQIKRFCDLQKVKPSTFGRLAIGDPNLVTNLEAGRSVTLKIANRIADWMAAYQTEAPKQADAA